MQKFVFMVTTTVSWRDLEGISFPLLVVVSAHLIWSFSYSFDSLYDSKNLGEFEIL